VRFAIPESHYLRTPSGENLEGLPPAERALRFTKRVPVTMDIHPTQEVVARVNEGRWIADCPFCAGAQFTSPDDRRFLCADCGNEAIDGKWMRVVWPAAPEVIEDVLIVRPTENRHWFPYESVADLARENAAHGLGEA
jgi:hypothetical protein